ncbi:MAG: GNAT family N-acetyltransferase [Capsulimonadales bacterium]|nr:GNAT family N-acetyltransferase [Capsulimonadales bacterium]
MSAISAATPDAAVRIAIRPAVTSDYEAAARLFRFTMGEAFVLDRALWEETCSGESYRVFVGEEEDGRIVSLAVVIVSDRIRLAAGIRRRRFHLDELIVDPSCRRQGIGHAMLEHLKAEAAREAPSYILVNCDFMDVAARRTYESAGLNLVRQSGDRFEITFR